jgi:hypothetical protein
LIPLTGLSCYVVLSVCASRSASNCRASGVPMEASRRTVNENNCGTFESSASGERSRHVELRHRLGGVPHHQRLSLIDGVFGVRDEFGQHVPAFLRRNPLQYTRQTEAYER